MRSTCGAGDHRAQWACFASSLGAEYVPDQVTAQKLNLKGVVILSVDPDGAAAKAGLQGITPEDNGDVQIGDVITAVDGEPVAKINQLDAALDKHKIGDTVTLTIERDGQKNRCEGDVGRRGVSSREAAKLLQRSK